MSAPGPRMRFIELPLVVGTIAICAGLYAGLMPRHREASRIRVCAANLRGLGSAMYIYAQDGDTFPMATSSHRAGEMTLFAYRNPAPLADEMPSPTADLWMIVRTNNATQRQHICPSSTDIADPIDDTTTVFDFAGPENLSYAYVYQYHPGRRPLGTGSHPNTPLMADANPYVKGGIYASVATDRASVNRGNSRNHRARKGQNILWVDGHVAFERSPRFGPMPGHNAHYPPQPADNIYTTHADNEPSDPGNAPTWTRIQIGSKSDYCLVP